MGIASGGGEGGVGDVAVADARDRRGQLHCQDVLALRCVREWVGGRGEMAIAVAMESAIQVQRDTRGASDHYDIVGLGRSGGACARGDHPLRELVARTVSHGAENRRGSGRRRRRSVLGGSLPAVENRRR